MAAELVDHMTSLMCITERTMSDISDKPAFSPPGHIKREQCKSKEALFCNFFDFFLLFRTRCVTKLFSGWLLVRSIQFQAGNFTCIIMMKYFEDISFKSLLLQRKDLKNTLRRL